MKKTAVNLSLILIGILILISFAGSTYGYFDVLRDTRNANFNIGSWQIIDNVIEYLNQTANETENENFTSSEILNYVSDIIWDNTVFDDSGNLVSGNLANQYADYTESELIELVDIVIDYTDQFLINDTNGNISFPERINVSSTEIPLNTMLQPGESTQVPSVLLTADLYDDIYWAPIMYSISIESPQGEDISDYALEILYNSAFAERFSYTYLIRDYTSYNNNRAQGNISKKRNEAVTVTDSLYTDLSVYKYNNDNYVNTLFRHYLELPSFGNWSRFIKGPNMYLDKPSNSSIGMQQQLNSTNKEREGIILMGKPNGTQTELRLGIFDRGSVGDLIKDIPIILNLSRGIKLDENGNPLSYEYDTAMPTIKIRMVSGDVWGN